MIDTEGKTFSSPNSSIHKKIDVFPNLYFFWNNVEMNKYKKEMIKKIVLVTLEVTFDQILS